MNVKVFFITPPKSLTLYLLLTKRILTSISTSTPPIIDPKETTKFGDIQNLIETGHSLSFDESNVHRGSPDDAETIVKHFHDEGSIQEYYRNI